MDYSSSIEKIGTGLVCSLETFKGAKIELVNRRSGFNGLSVYKNGKVRKIEVKTMQRADKWIAINGIRAIDKLFFERDYWIYFVLVPENIVITTKGLSFIKKQLKSADDTSYLEDLELWMKTTKRLANVSGFMFTPKINVLFSTPIRKLVNNILNGEMIEEWDKSVIEVWQNKQTWERLFLSVKYDEI
ncbi:MAG: hypothetical protein HY964_03245 [Ignavibacteriales bacterium]|nr:hypothetical protein [Ignavibacteriales bacterium]